MFDLKALRVALLADAPRHRRFISAPFVAAARNWAAEEADEEVVSSQEEAGGGEERRRRLPLC